jgi:signal transduction histidine kinase
MGGCQGAQREGNAMKPRSSFTRRLSWALAGLLLAYGAFVAVLGAVISQQHGQETLQRLSHGLAGHIVGHWPEIAAPDPAQADRAAREALLEMLMVVNPGVQVYLLDADGRVDQYLGEPGMVRQFQVDLIAVRAFLQGARLPIRGTDPMDASASRLFSVAMFPPRAGDTRPPGYLYVVLDGSARQSVAGLSSIERVFWGAAVVAGVGALLTLAIGAFALRRLTRPLQALARRIGQYQSQAGAGSTRLPVGDEVQALDQAFSAMASRIEADTQREREQMLAHRETLAGVAHDLRTPLTALHGQLEALAAGTPASADARQQVLGAALAQSDRLRRLSQQLFELAALQSSGQVVHRERFRLDELVNDTVQKFGATATSPAVTLSGPMPAHGGLELDGDLQLIERALTNLIDNAMRHAPTAAAVNVSLHREGAQAHIVVEDSGPGLPADLLQRLEAGQSLRDPPLAHRHGGIGGLGLAIAQRVATLHGGSLRPLPAPGGGTRLCLALPLAG